MHPRLRCNYRYGVTVVGRIREWPLTSGWPSLRLDRPPKRDRWAGKPSPKPRPGPGASRRRWTASASHLCRGRRFCDLRKSCTISDDDRHLTAHQFDGEWNPSVRMSFCSVALDSHVTTINEPDVSQPSIKRREVVR